MVLGRSNMASSNFAQGMYICRPFYVLMSAIPAQSLGARGSVVVKALFYKPEGREFDTRWGEFLNLHNPSGRTRVWDLFSL
jgi:hypothetical protein